MGILGLGQLACIPGDSEDTTVEVMFGLVVLGAV